MSMQMRNAFIYKGTIEVNLTQGTEKHYFDVIGLTAFGSEFVLLAVLVLKKAVHFSIISAVVFVGVNFLLGLLLEEVSKKKAHSKKWQRRYLRYIIKYPYSPETGYFNLKSDTADEVLASAKRLLERIS